MMELQIRPPYTYDLLQYLKQAESYGQLAVLLDAPGGVLIQPGWVAFMTVTEALEKIRPGEHCYHTAQLTAHVERVFNELPPAERTKAVNYHELRMQLYNLGFDEKEAIEQLRTYILEGKDRAISIDISKSELSEFTLYFRKEAPGYRLYCIDASKRNPKNPKYATMQHFLPQVHCNTALELLRLDQALGRQYRDPFMPLNLAQTKDLIAMNTQLQYLGEQLEKLGFADLKDDLRKKLEAGKESFTLAMTEGPANYQLQFDRHRHYDHLEFAHFQLTVDGKSQYFRVQEDKGFTAREAFNLMEGRSVFKSHTDRQGMTYTAWNVLSEGKVLQFTGAGRFHLNDMPEPNIFALKALHQGDKVEIEHNGQTCYLQVDPLRRQIDILDKNGKAIKKVPKTEPPTNTPGRKLKH